MKTLVLAAGRSRRIKPIEDKNFLKFAGKTLLEHQLDTLQRVGLTDIILAGGAHNLAQLQEIAEMYKAQVVEQKNLDEGMAGAVLAAQDLVGEEALLIFSSNDVLAQSAFESIQLASQSEADAYLLAYRVQDYFPGGYLKVDGKRITGIVEKPTPGEEPSDLINLVLHLHKKPQALFKA